MRSVDYIFSLGVFTANLRERCRRLRRVAYSWCRNSAEADDLVQDTLIKAFKNLGRLRDTRSLDAWLFGILRNCWRDHLRSRRPAGNIDELCETELFPCDDALERTDVKFKVRYAVARLPVDQREVLALVDLAGFSYPEVADMLAVPVGTVTSRLSRAREALRRVLVELDEEQASRVARIRRIK